MMGIVKSIIGFGFGFIAGEFFWIIIGAISNTFGSVSPLWQPPIDIIGAINLLDGIPVGLLFGLIGMLLTICRGY